MVQVLLKLLARPKERPQSSSLSERPKEEIGTGSRTKERVFLQRAEERLEKDPSEG